MTKSYQQREGENRALGQDVRGNPINASPKNNGGVWIFKTLWWLIAPWKGFSLKMSAFVLIAAIYFVQEGNRDSRPLNPSVPVQSY